MNLMKVFIFFGISIAKKGCFYKYSNTVMEEIDCYFQGSVFNQMSLIFISVDKSHVAGGKDRGRLDINNHC